MIVPWNRHLAPAASETLLVRSWKRFCIEKCNISRSGYLPKCHQMLRLPRKVTIQLHQILRLPRKMNLMIDARLIWNVISNAQSKQCQPPTSANTAPATKSLSSRLQRKLPELLPPIYRRFEDNPTMIRPWSDHEIVISHPPLRRPYSSDLGNDFVLKNTTFRAPAISQNVTKCCACHEKWQSNFTKYCACHAKCISWLIRVTYETSFRMRGASKVNLEPQQIPHLPRKMNLMIDPRLIWNVISNAQSKQSQPPTSANTAPATQNESHDWSASHMKRHLQSAEQAQSASNLTKYCACHEICKFQISAETPWIASANRRFDDNPTIIRPWSDHDPTMIRPWNRHLAPAASETLLVRSWRRFCIEKYNISRSGYLPKCHEMLCLPRKVTLQLHQLLRLPRKMNLLASILSWHLFSLGIYSLLASILSWHLFSLGIYSLLASILSRHLFSLGIYSLLASILSRHLFSLGIYSL